MSLFEEGAFFTTPPGKKIILKFDPQFDHFGVKLEKNEGHHGKKDKNVS